jgi:hypothetical protein
VLAIGAKELMEYFIKKRTASSGKKKKSEDIE